MVVFSEEEGSPLKWLLCAACVVPLVMKELSEGANLPTWLMRVAVQSLW